MISQHLPSDGRPGATRDTVTGPQPARGPILPDSFAEPPTRTDPLTYAASSADEGIGDETVIRVPMNDRTTVNDTAVGRFLMFDDPGHRVTTYIYDGRDRLTRIIYPDLTTRDFDHDDRAE